MTRTPGHELETYLNKNYGPGNEFYEDFCTYIRRAVKEDEGWVATIEMDGCGFLSHGLKCILTLYQQPQIPPQQGCFTQRRHQVLEHHNRVHG